MNITELRSRREVYGHDERAINRHSVRTYQVTMPDERIFLFTLDRTLDGVPPFYSLSHIKDTLEPGEVYFPKTVKVNGEQYWGDGLSWPQAEKLLPAAFATFIAQ